MQEPATTATASRSPTHAPGRSPAFAFFCAYALFVVYATLLPFQFVFGRDFLAEKRGYINWNPLTMTTGERTPVTDVVMNVAFFVPLGIIGYHAQRRRGVGAHVARASLAGVALSLGVETAQLFTPTRNPSSSDVLTNGLGTLLGCLLAAGFETRFRARVQRQARSWMRREPLLPVLAAFFLVVVLAALVPFDFAPTLSLLKRALRAARLDPRHDPSAWRAAVPLALQYAVLAGLGLATAARMRIGSAAGRVLGVLAACGLLAAGLEIAQLLVRSRTTTSRDVVMALAGALLGVAVSSALGVGKRARYAWSLVAAACVAAIAFEALVPFEFDFRLQALASRLSYTALVPYSSYYYKANVAAVADFLESLLAYAPFAFVLAQWRSRRGALTTRAGFAVVAQCAGLALVLEVVQLGVPRRYAEISDVLTAALAGGLGAYAWRWIAHLAAGASHSTSALSTPASEAWAIGMAEDEASVVSARR